MNIFIPNMYQKDIFSINYLKLKDKGFKLIIFDLDNTIGSIHEKKCNIKTSNFLNSLNKDFKIVIVSNSLPKRVSLFCENIECEIFSLSLKPTLKSIRKIKNKYHIPYDKMVIVGDQIMTDIFVGNRKGLFTILVDPIKDIDFKITGFNRKIEKIINKKNNIVKGNYYEN